MSTNKNFQGPISGKRATQKPPSKIVAEEIKSAEPQQESDLEELSQESLFVHKEEFKETVLLLQRTIERWAEETERRTEQEKKMWQEAFLEINQKLDQKLEGIEIKVSDLGQGISKSVTKMEEKIEDLDSRIRNLEVIGGYMRDSDEGEVFSPTPITTVTGRSLPNPRSTRSFEQISHSQDSDPATQDLRRDSIIGTLQTDAKRLMVNDQRHLTVKSEAHMKIKWTEKTLDGFIKFVTDISLFQQAHQQAVFSLFTHFSVPIQNEVENLLLNHMNATYTERSQVVRAPLEHIYEVLLHLFKPRDLAMFNELLFTSCVPYRVKNSETNYRRDFDKVRSRIYTLKRAFLERYRFLVEAAKKTKNERSIPAFNFKDGGLFQTWLLLTPTGMRKSFQRELDREKYDSIEKFFIAYFAYLEETYDMMEKSRLAEGRVLDIPEEPDPVFKQHGNIRDHNNNTRGIHQLDSADQRSSYSRSNRFQRRQSELYEMDGSDQDSYQEDVQEELDEEDCDYGGHRVAQDTVFAVDQRRHSNAPVRWGSESSRPSRNKGPPCHKFVFEGECVDPLCRFNHDLTLIREERQKKFLQLQRIQEPRPRSTPPPPPGRPPEAYNAAQRSISKSSEPIQRVHVMEEGEELVEPGGDFNQIEALMRIQEPNVYWKAAHKEASVKIAGSEEVIDARIVTLFDTGASSGNFVSSSFISKYALQPFLVKVNKKVKVANGTRVDIDSKVMLEVTFSTDHGATTAILDFNVMRGLSLDIIIGLPAICNHFKDVLAEMMGKVASHQDELSGNLQVSLIQSSPLIDPEWLHKQSIPPWSQFSVVSEEELMIPEPGSVTSDFIVMGQQYDAQLEEFLTQLESRVHPDFAQATQVIPFLRTEAVGVFVPRRWEGIRGIDLVQLEFIDSPPRRLKPKSRRIPASIYEATKKEFQRLLTYFYEPSNSSITSPIVVAPKATSPFVRVCGDYRLINKLLKVFNFPIPDIIKEMHKAGKCKVFIDLDMRNAFHNLRLHPSASEILSVQTPFGQFQPRFLPEGVAPASGILMSVMTDIFGDYLDWIIVIWDNILICAVDFQDAFDKLKLVIQRCKERDVYLKLSKSWFGFPHAEFFGYLCREGSYSLTADRIKEVTSIPFPSGGNKLKKMQQFLGCAVFFKPFIFNFAEKAAALTEMTAKDFSWDSKLWKKDYQAAYESFKLDIANAFTLYHPDYTLPWFLYVDASDVAVGGVLIQVTLEGQQQVIAFVSKKFTSSAVRWSTIEKEAFAMFYACQKLSYYLFAKKFTMLTDHNNLLWMESSEVPKIVRMRIFLQEFNFLLVHVPGKDNIFADWLSRMHDSTASASVESQALLQALGEVEETLQLDSISSKLLSVHNSRMGHHGAYRTWLMLNKYHPGHGIPMRMVSDFVRECAFCQKVRDTVSASLPPPTRAIVADHPRHLCGYDTLYVTPADDEGFQYLHVFKMIPSRLVALYPSKSLSAESLASAAFQFFVTYGVTDVLITDPGANITSDVVKLLLQWFGIRLRISLTGRHQSNGVERTHREILRFLTVLVNTETLKKCWSKPHVLGIVQFILNSERSAETGVSPFEYTFGSSDAPYFKLPDPDGVQGEYLRLLNQDLERIRQAAQEVQRNQQLQRVSGEVLNTYSVGDYVLFDEASRGFRGEKLRPRFSGPYVVVAIHKADVSCQHIVTAVRKTFHMENLKPFVGSLNDAYSAAKADDDQFVILQILEYLGDPEKRTSMSFFVEFEGNEKVWLDYNTDLASSSPFQTFCSARPELEPLTMSAAEWKARRTQYNSQPIVDVSPGLHCYVNLKAWGNDYFRSLELPIGPRYVVLCEYVKWTSSRRRKIDVRCPLFNQLFEWDSTNVRLYGLSLSLEQDMQLVDTDFARKHPRILE